MKKPNFFIVGAPKCGTTSLSEYLGEHPNIFMSVPKEPLYFAEDFKTARKMNTFDAYISIFRRSNATHLAVGEASAIYLYSSVAIKNIYSFNDKAKIIVMLRNPIDFLLSLHAQFVYGFGETEENFESAWRLQASRQEGKNIPTACLDPSFLQYAQIAKFGNQVENVLRIFPQEQVKIILLEDFTKKTREVYEDVLAFLNVPSNGRLDFPVINERKQHKVVCIGKLMSYRPLPLKVLENWIRELLVICGVRPKKVWHTIIKINSKPVAKQSLSTDFRRELIGEFKEDIEKLSTILRRNLSHWIM